jgi:hypothetical protein
MMSQAARGRRPQRWRGRRQRCEQWGKGTRRKDQVNVLCHAPWQRHRRMHMHALASGKYNSMRVKCRIC